MTSQRGPRAALDTFTLNLLPSQAPVLRTILSSSSPSLSYAEWYAYEIVYWSLDSKRDKKERPEFRVFETFAERSPEGLTNDEMHFSAQCQANKLDILASKLQKPADDVDEGEQRGSIAFIALIPVKPDSMIQAKEFLTGPYAAVVQAETVTRYWYAFQRDATTLGLFGVWADEEELKVHMEGAVDMLDKGLEPFMSGPFDRRKGSMIAYRT